MRENLDFLIRSFQTFSEWNPIWLVYLAAVLYILFFTKRQGRILFLLPLLIQLLTVFNPVLCGILAQKAGFSERYLRFFWMVPFFMTIAYAGVHLIGRIRIPAGKAAALAAMSAAIILAGNPVFPGDNPQLQYVKADNYTFTDQELLFLEYYFHVEGIENPRVLYDNYLVLKYRMWDPSVRSVITRDYLMEMLSQDEETFLALEERNKYRTVFQVYAYRDFSVDPVDFRKAFERCKIDYMAVRADSVMVDYLIRGGFEMVGNTGTYQVWK